MTGTEDLQKAISDALGALNLEKTEIILERPRNREHGDWSSNVALRLSKSAKKPPREVADDIAKQLQSMQFSFIDSIEVAGPGFINFRLSKDAVGSIVQKIVDNRDNWGNSKTLEGQKINLEFVSANPTGPLHPGHLRWAFLGDAMASLLEVVGAEVTREYYINDAGNQMGLFGKSVQARMRGKDVPEDGYRGAYIADIAEQLNSQGVNADDLEAVTEAGYQLMLERIKQSLLNVGVRFDVWTSERTLHEGKIDEALNILKDRGEAYEQDGALWLRTTDHGDDKDRVLIKANGDLTYFAADVAYLANKQSRGFDIMIYLLGADHHGYVPRLKAIAKSWGLKDGAIEAPVGQLVNFLRDGEVVRMSKRSGDMLTADEVIEEIGADAARYTLLRTSADTALTVDIADVIAKNKDNPVHYINYSYARIEGISRKAKEIGFTPTAIKETDLSLLTEDTATALIAQIEQLPEVIEKCAQDRAPYRLARYAEEVADCFHKFYTECQVLGEDQMLSSARFWLCEAAKITIGKALNILGVTPQEEM